MLESIFTKLLILSVQAGFLIMAILIIRALFKKIPKKIICLLWCMAALRLLIPVTIESPVSLVPGEQTIQEVFVPEERVEYVARETEGVVQQITPIEAGIVESIENPQLSEEVKEAYTYTPEAEGSVGTDTNKETTYIYEQSGKTSDLRMLVIYLWLLGSIILLSYGVFTYVRVRIKVRDAVHHEENVWFSDRIDTPFLLGYIKPRIYMPFFVDESRREYIIAHEMGHIRRGDHITKLIGYTLLSVYWFQPLVWVAYVLFCKDVEMACDEMVIAEMGEEKKKAYSQTLLLCSVDKHYLLANPLAFGEIDVKKRITNVLSYKKPGVIISIISVVILLLAAVFFLTNGEEERTPGSTTLSDYQKEYLETLSNGTRYAVVPMEGAEEPLLLTTTDNWEEPAFENEPSSIYMSYCMFEYVGAMSATGSSYPVRADEEAVYLMDEHQLTVMTVAEAVSPVTGRPYLEWASYTEEDKEYEKILEKYNETDVVEFNNVIENTASENEVLTDEQMEYLKTLAPESRLAIIPLNGAPEPLLLATTGVYEDPSFDNAEVSFFAEYCMLGNVGSINTGGTAYPIRADYEAVYLASGHSLSVLTISEAEDSATGKPYLETTVYSEDDDAYAEMLERCRAAMVVKFEIQMTYEEIQEEMEEKIADEIDQLGKIQAANAKERESLDELMNQLLAQMEETKKVFEDLEIANQEVDQFKAQYGASVRTVAKNNTEDEYRAVAKEMFDEYMKMDSLLSSTLHEGSISNYQEDYIEVDYEQFPDAKSVQDYIRQFCTEEMTNQWYSDLFETEHPALKEVDGKLYTTFYDGIPTAYSEYDSISILDASSDRIVYTIYPSAPFFEEQNTVYFVQMERETDRWVVADCAPVMTKGSHDYYPETVYQRVSMDDYEVVLQDYTTREGGPLEVAVIRGDESKTLEVLYEEWQRDPAKVRVDAAGEIFGYDCFYVYDFGLFHTVTTDFYAVVDGEVKQLATSFGDDPENNTFIKDLDGDGENELICNVTYSADGRQNTRIFKREGDKILWAGVSFELLENWEEYIYCPAYYDTESGKIVVEEWKDNGETEHHYFDIVLEELEFYDYVPGY